jgi:transposase-like protein
VQTATEHAPVSATVLRALVARGLRYAQGRLVILDGATGLRKAIQTVVGAQALGQRGQWHTREQVLRYLPTGQQATWRQPLQAAYERPTDAEATAALRRLRRELTLVNESAGRRLDDGLEETLPLPRLGLFGPLGISLTTTNCLESRNAQLGAYTATVDRWRSSDQTQRWGASALLTIEPRLRRIMGDRHLLLLQAALQREIASSTQRRESVA